METTASEVSKHALRKQMRRVLQAEAQEAPICQWDDFLNSDLFCNSDAIIGYIAIQKELPLDSILKATLKQSKALFLPRFLNDRYTLARVHNLSNCLVTGKFGIPEPAEWCPSASALPENTLWLVPGLAFDTNGRRLGRGGGFYDRLLADFPQGTPIGVCRDCQILSKVPFDAHDVQMKAILTPSSWISSLYVPSSSNN